MLGPSGGSHSSLMRPLARLQPPDSGSMHFRNIGQAVVQGEPERLLDEVRGHIWRRFVLHVYVTSCRAMASSRWSPISQTGPVTAWPMRRGGRSAYSARRRSVWLRSADSARCCGITPRRRTAATPMAGAQEDLADT